MFSLLFIFTHLNKHASQAVGVCSIGRVESAFPCFVLSITDLQKLCQFSFALTVPGHRNVCYQRCLMRVTMKEAER